jgi:hypothetical protein
MGITLAGLRQKRLRVGGAGSDEHAADKTADDRLAGNNRRTSETHPREYFLIRAARQQRLNRRSSRPRRRGCSPPSGGCAERGLSCLRITHNLAIVPELCEQTAVLYLGRIAGLRPTAATAG